MLSPLRDWLIGLGLGEEVAAAATVAADSVVVLLVALISDHVARRIVVGRVRALAARSATRWDDSAVKYRVFERLAHIAPAVVVYLFAAPVLEGYGLVAELVQRGALACVIFVTAKAGFAAANAAEDIVRDSPLAPSLPARGIAQVVKMALFAVAAVSIVSVVLNHSPLLLLSGLGAMSAVLIFVFRDAILGFVAGVQLSVNRMVSPGDWIEMPAHGVDGDVLEVGLTTAKIQNFDMTITTLPTYTLVSEPFKNWRGMAESEGRRIKRALHIDIGSVRFCNEEMLARFARIRYITEHVEARRKALDELNREEGVDAADYANGRRLTNVGLFRAYVVAYLRNHPMVHQDMTFLVRQLDPTERGLPLEIYVFCRDQDWARYEAIQADIFDHLLAIVPQFDLRIFQNPTGPDVERALRSTGAGAAAARAGVTAA